MSGLPSSSQHPRSVVQWESKSSAQKVYFETSYKPSWRTETSYKPSEGATAGKASVVASSQHTDPNERSARRTDQWATSKELGSHNSSMRNAWRSLNCSSTASQAEDSERIISELRQEIRDLRQEARSRSPAKERPRNRVNALKRKNLEHSTLSLNSRSEDFSETSYSQSESRSLTPRIVPKQPLELGGHSQSCPPLHSGKGPQTKEHTSRKTARLGGQNAVWRGLDLVSSFPFSREIKKAELPERYTVLRHSSAFRSIQRPNKPSGPYRSLSTKYDFVSLQRPPHVSNLPIKPWRNRTEMVQPTWQTNNQLMDSDGRSVCGTLYYKQSKNQGNGCPPYHDVSR